MNCLAQIYPGNCSQKEIYLSTVKEQAFTFFDKTKIKIDDFIQECLLRPDTPSKKIRASFLSHVTKICEFISFIEKSLDTAASCGVIEENKVLDKKIALYSTLAEGNKNISGEELRGIPSSLFQTIYLKRHPKILEQYFSSISKFSEKVETLEWAASLGFCRWVLLKLLVIDLSFKDIESIYSILNKTNPLEFKEILIDRPWEAENDPFRVLSGCKKVELLKENSTVRPDDLVDLMQSLCINDPQDQMNVAWHFLSLYQEEMLYKIENFHSLSMQQKLELFLKAVVLHPRLMAFWKAAFFLKTRLELAKTSSFIEMLMFFESAAKEDKDENEELQKLRFKWSELFGDERVFSHLTLNFLEMPYSARKELLLWLAYTVDKASLVSAEIEPKMMVQSVLSLAQMDPQLRYSLTAYLFEPGFAKLSRGSSQKSVAENILEFLGSNEKSQTLLLSSNPKSFTSILSTLIHMQIHPNYSDKTKREYTQQILASNHSQEMVIKANALYALISINDEGIENISCDSSIDVIDRFCEVMRNWLGMEISDPLTFMKRYSETFGSFRIPQGLIVYAKGLQGLHNSQEKKAILNSLQELVKEVHSNTFLKNRYDPKRSPHLQLLFSLYSDLETAWKSNTIEGKITGFLDKPPRVSISDCIVQETDHIEEMFLCTTETGGSCLSIYGDSEDNKGFLAYFFDGKNKVLVVTENGKIIGRTLLRLLIDAEQNPVLLLDTFYTSLPYLETKDKSSSYEQLEHVLEEAAKRKATALKVPLLRSFSSTDAELSLYPLPVLSHGGRALYECCNAMGALGENEICLDSKYKIEKVLVIQNRE